MTFLLIFIAGGLGTSTRYALLHASSILLGDGFGYGTLIANLVGSFLMGILMYFAIHTDFVSTEFRLVLGVGFLGGFTTYSTFNQETLAFLESGSYALAMANIFFMLFICLGAGWLGTVVAHTILKS